MLVKDYVEKSYLIAHCLCINEDKNQIKTQKFQIVFCYKEFNIVIYDYTFSLQTLTKTNDR